MQGSEGQVGLGLDTGHPENARLRFRGGVLQESRFADARLATHDQSAGPALQQLADDGLLRLTPIQHGTPTSLVPS